MAQEIELQALADILIERAGAGRLVVAVAGAPGSGKSTFSERLVEFLDMRAPGTAAILPMDGFHYDDAVLDALGRRGRKGAADTFDVAGFRHMLARLRDNSEETVALPVFDRDLEIARAGARLVAQDVRVIVAEGNYLLLRHAPWSGLRPLFDVTVFIEAGEETLRKRLVRRWQHYGLSAEEIEGKVEGNDLPNGRLVSGESIEPDYRVRN